jgi:MerR family transcriptional regulator, copper efflux regulator
MRISELARRCGISTHRLRRYERDGLIPGVRTDGGYRDFAESCVREVRFIAMGRELGFPLSQLGELLPRYRAGTLSIDEMIDGLRQRMAEIDADIAERRALRRRLVSHIGWFERRRARSEPARPPANAFAALDRASARSPRSKVTPRGKA